MGCMKSHWLLRLSEEVPEARSNHTCLRMPRDSVIFSFPLPVIGRFVWRLCIRLLKEMVKDHHGTSFGTRPIYAVPSFSLCCGTRVLAAQLHGRKEEESGS